MKQRLPKCLRKFIDCETLKARQMSLANDKPSGFNAFFNIS